MEMAPAVGVALDQVKTRQPARQAADEIAGDAFGSGERQNAVGIRIVAERRHKRDFDAAARQIDCRVECIAPAAERQAALVACNLDHNFADRDNAASLLVHGGSSPALRACHSTAGGGLAMRPAPPPRAYCASSRRAGKWSARRSHRGTARDPGSTGLCVLPGIDGFRRPIISFDLANSPW